MSKIRDNLLFTNYINGCIDAMNFKNLQKHHYHDLLYGDSLCITIKPYSKKVELHYESRFRKRKSCHIDFNLVDTCDKMTEAVLDFIA